MNIDKKIEKFFSTGSRGYLCGAGAMRLAKSVLISACILGGNINTSLSQTTHNGTNATQIVMDSINTLSEKQNKISPIAYEPSKRFLQAAEIALSAQANSLELGKFTIGHHIEMMNACVQKASVHGKSILCTYDDVNINIGIRLDPYKREFFIDKINKANGTRVNIAKETNKGFVYTDEKSFKLMINEYIALSENSIKDKCEDVVKKCP